MAPTVDFVWEVQQRGHVGNQIHLNIWHYRIPLANTATFNGDTATRELAVNWYNDIWNGISAGFHESYRLDTVVAKSIQGAIVNPVPEAYVPIYNDQYVFNVPTGEGQGERTGDPTPTFVCVGYQKLTDRPGRNYRGSFRISPILEADTDANALTPTAITFFDTNEEAFIEEVIDSVVPPENVFELCVYSVKANALGPGGGGPNPRAYTAKVTGLRLNTLTTSQVSRKERPLA